MSKQLDDELAQAAGLDSDEVKANSSVAKGVPAVAARRGGSPSGTNLGLLAGLLAIVGALVALFLFGFKDGAAIYAMPVDQLLAQQDKMVNRKVRIDGELVPGTLVKRDKPCEYRFKIHAGKPDKQLTVAYPQCLVTESLRDVPGGGVQVTVEGALNQSGDFDASLIMAKCTSKYDPKTHKMGDGQGMPVN